MKIFLLSYASYRHLRRDITRPSACSRVVDVTLNGTLLIAYASEVRSRDERRTTGVYSFSYRTTVREPRDAWDSKGEVVAGVVLDRTCEGWTTYGRWGTCSIPV